MGARGPKVKARDWLREQGIEGEYKQLLEGFKKEVESHLKSKSKSLTDLGNQCQEITNKNEIGLERGGLDRGELTKKLNGTNGTRDIFMSSGHLKVIAKALVFLGCLPDYPAVKNLLLTFKYDLSLDKIKEFIYEIDFPRESIIRWGGLADLAKIYENSPRPKPEPRNAELAGLLSLIQEKLNDKKNGHYLELARPQGYGKTWLLYRLLTEPGSSKTLGNVKKVKYFIPSQAGEQSDQMLLSLAQQLLLTDISTFIIKDNSYLKEQVRKELENDWLYKEKLLMVIDGLDNPAASSLDLDFLPVKPRSGVVIVLSASPGFKLSDQHNLTPVPKPEDNLSDDEITAFFKNDSRFAHEDLNLKPEQRTDLKGLFRDNLLGFKIMLGELRPPLSESLDIWLKQNQDTTLNQLYERQLNSLKRSQPQNWATIILPTLNLMQVSLGKVAVEDLREWLNLERGLYRISLKHLQETLNPLVGSFLSFSDGAYDVDHSEAIKYLNDRPEEFLTKMDRCQLHLWLGRWCRQNLGRDEPSVYACQNSINHLYHAGPEGWPQLWEALLDENYWFKRFIKRKEDTNLKERTENHLNALNTFWHDLIWGLKTATEVLEETSGKNRAKALGRVFRLALLRACLTEINLVYPSDFYPVLESLGATSELETRLALVTDPLQKLKIYLELEPQSKYLGDLTSSLKEVAYGEMAKLKEPLLRYTVSLKRDRRGSSDETQSSNDKKIRELLGEVIKKLPDKDNKDRATLRWKAALELEKNPSIKRILTDDQLIEKVAGLALAGEVGEARQLLGEIKEQDKQNQALFELAYGLAWLGSISEEPVLAVEGWKAWQEYKKHERVLKEVEIECWLAEGFWRNSDQASAKACRKAARKLCEEDLPVRERAKGWRIYAGSLARCACFGEIREVIEKLERNYGPEGQAFGVQARCALIVALAKGAKKDEAESEWQQLNQQLTSFNPDRYLNTLKARLEALGTNTLETRLEKETSLGQSNLAELFKEAIPNFKSEGRRVFSEIDIILLDNKENNVLYYRNLAELGYLYYVAKYTNNEFSKYAEEKWGEINDHLDELEGTSLEKPELSCYLALSYIYAGEATNSQLLLERAAELLPPQNKLDFRLVQEDFDLTLATLSQAMLKTSPAKTKTYLDQIKTPRLRAIIITQLGEIYSQQYLSGWKVFCNLLPGSWDKVKNFKEFLDYLITLLPWLKKFPELKTSLEAGMDTLSLFYEGIQLLVLQPIDY